MMDSKVTRLHAVAHAGNTEPAADVIAQIEELLEEAKSGCVRAVAYAVVLDDGAMGAGWSGCENTHYMLCASLALAAQEFNQHIIEGR